MALRWNPVEVELLLRNTHGPIGQYLATIGALVETAAKNECPVRTGRLRSSINHRVEMTDRGMAAIIGTNVSYARYVHEGTSRMAGRPFLVNGMHRVLRG